MMRDLDGEVQWSQMWVKWSMFSRLVIASAITGQSGEENRTKLPNVTLNMRVRSNNCKGKR
jgi:hypothetical protein